MKFTFAAQTTYTVGTGPSSVATADVDGDGRLDLIAANAGSDTISVRLGQGDGTFGAEVTHAVGDAPSSVTVADFNHDGRMDLATADRDDGAVSVLLGLGGGAFAPRHIFLAGNAPAVALTAAPLDINGNPGLVVANGTAPGTVSLLQGFGDGSFAPPYSVSVGNAPSAVTVGNLSHDGMPDIVVPNAADNTVSVLVSFSSFGFVFLPVTLAVGGGPSAVAVADVNDDGTDDIIVTNRDDDTVSVLLNTGSFCTLFTAQPPVATGDAPSSVATADVNGDGHLDLIVANSGSDNVSVLFGNGDGTFAPQITFAVGDDPSAVAVADVNHDGNDDLIVSNHGGDTVSVLLGARTFAVTAVGTSPAAPDTLKIGDTVQFTAATEVPVSSVTPGSGGATPTLTLSNGATATYTGHDAAGLHFSYTVQAGHSEDTSDLLVTGLSLNGARLDNTDTPRTATLDPSLSVTSGTDTHLAVDTTVPDAPQAPPVPVVGTPGDDGFTAAAGSTIYIGLGGTDTLTFGFKLTEAIVSYAGNEVIIDGPGGSHTVTNGFEMFKFTDGTVNNADGNPLVDDLFYYSHNHDVWLAGADADLHFSLFGWKEGRDPNAFFSTNGYLATYTDVKAAGVNPLTHYDQHGWSEGRDPSPVFDTKGYFAAYPDVNAAHVDPLAHFLLWGAQEQRQPVNDGHFG